MKKIGYPWSIDEMEITLAYYFFIYKKENTNKNNQKFAYDLIKMSGIQRTVDSVNLRIANFAYVDPLKKSKSLSGGEKNVDPSGKSTSVTIINRIYI